MKLDFPARQVMFYSQGQGCRQVVSQLLLKINLDMQELLVQWAS